MNRTLIYIAFSCCLLVQLVFQVEVAAGWKSEREQLDKVYKVGKFRIFYTLEGKNALANQTDSNINGVPDLVENVAIQLDVADTLYRDVFGFVDPLASERYRGRVKTIDVHIIVSRSMGVSGDGVLQYNYANKDIQNDGHGSLTITLSNKIKTGNLSPAHELMHSYLNGYTMFKNRWFTEGTARWMEYAFKQGTGKQKIIPDTLYDIEKLLQRKYSAKYFWNRLAFLCSENPVSFRLPVELQNKSYVGTDQKVIEGNDLYGFRFMSGLFDNLGHYSSIVSNEKGFDTFDWDESDQKSTENNRYILMALRKTILDAKCASIDEISIFLDLAVPFIEGKNGYKNDAPDLTSKIEYIGTPYQDVYPKTEEAYARNIWDMVTYRGLLFVGGGNSNNSGPTPNAGPVPVISYNPQTGQFKKEATVDDEQINTFVILNDTLYIPGADATESHKFGNYYFRNDNGSWSKKRNIPNALHTICMQFFNRRLMAGISTPRGGAVAISNNDGEEWKVVVMAPGQRTYALLIADGQLYAVMKFFPKRVVEKWSPLLQEEYHGVAQLQGNNSFVPRHDLTEYEIFPDIILDKDRSKRILHSAQAGDIAVYLGGYNFKLPFGFYVARSIRKNGVDVKRIRIPRVLTPRDFLVRGNTLYLLCTERKNKRYVQKVIKISLADVTDFKVLFQFSTSTFARSFEELNGDFYFGLGSGIRNSRKWTLDEISPDTGKIIKISGWH